MNECSSLWWFVSKNNLLPLLNSNLWMVAALEDCPTALKHLSLLPIQSQILNKYWGCTSYVADHDTRFSEENWHGPEHTDITVSDLWW